MLNEPAKLGPRPVETDPSERRKSVRYTFTAAAEVTELKTLTRIIGQTSDLARGGCFVDVISPFPGGTAVRVRLALEQRAFEAQARVVYSQNGMGMGLAFLSAQPEHIKILDGWLAGLSGNTPAEPAVAEAARIATPPTPQQEAERSGDLEPKFVLNELIIALMRKRVLSEAEGKVLLQKLMR